MTQKTTSLQTAAMAMVDLPTTGDVPDWVHLLPAAQGEVRTFDGRGPYRVVDPAAIIAASLGADPRNAAGLLIDENHALEIAAKQGGPSPSRGRITEMQARDDDIWAKVDWTPTGRALLAERAYRGISPVIVYDPQGVIHQIKNAALVNYPNLRGQVALNQETEMTFQEQPAKLRGLPATATEAEILAAVPAKAGEVALQAQISEIGTALGVTDGNATAILAAATAKTKAAPAEMVAMQTELTKVSTDFAALQTATRREKATAFIDAAIAAARPDVKPRRDYYIARHMEDPVETEATVNAIPSFGPGRDTSPAKQVTATTADLTALNAEQQGRILHDRAVAYQSEQKVKGLSVKLHDAIAHVKQEVLL
jgi:phage I-like protein